VFRVRAHSARHARRCRPRRRRDLGFSIFRCARPARICRRDGEPDRPAAALVGEEDADFAGGSYVVIQKYLHDLKAWARVPTQVQEAIIGRTKIDNIEIDDDDAPRKSHKSLATIADADGTEYDILRDNMPFGRPGQQEFGTYFIGYSRYLWVIEKMLQRMYVGDPPGAYDRLLDFSTPHSGATFFAPARPTLQKLVEAAQVKIAAAPTGKPPAP
jgi:porphyrinogen peroxidase